MIYIISSHYIVSLPYFENSNPEPNPFHISIQTTVKPSFMKIGLYLYIQIWRDDKTMKNMKL